MKKSNGINFIPTSPKNKSLIRKPNQLETYETSLDYFNSSHKRNRNRKKSKIQ